jgi:hypothetical protein
MKTLINLKLLLGLLFFLNLQSTIFNQLSFNLYAQDPELFEHTWHFESGNFEGEDFWPLPYFTGNLDFYKTVIEIYHDFCDSAGGALLIEINNEQFHLQDFSVPFQGNCIDNEEIIFLNKHYSIYGNWNTGVCNNPFFYTIEAVDDYFKLTIENGEGGWAVYNSVLLSTNSFYQNSFTIYPNPVAETLFVKNTFNQAVQANVYDVSGKLQQSHFVEAGQSQIDVNHLHTGLYFVVFEGETGERVSKKFIKQ